MSDAPAMVRAEPGDWRAYRDVRLEALADAPSAFGSTHARESQLTEAEWRLRLSRSATFLAVAGDVAVGLATGLPEEGGAELVSMWVRRDHRGTGLADRLVAAVTAWAAEAGFPSIGLCVAEGNRQAEGLYRRHGFVPTGTVQPVVEGQPERLELRMSLQLPGRAAPG